MVENSPVAGVVAPNSPVAGVVAPNSPVAAVDPNIPFLVAGFFFRRGFNGSK